MLPQLLFYTQSINYEQINKMPDRPVHWKIAWIIISEPQDIAPFEKDINVPFLRPTCSWWTAYDFQSRWESEGQTLLLSGDEKIQDQPQWVSTMFLVGVNWLYMLEPNPSSRSEMPQRLAKDVGSFTYYVILEQLLSVSGTSISLSVKEWIELKFSLSKGVGKGNGNPLQYRCLENPMEEEPGRLRSMGSQRVRHHWATFHFSPRVFEDHLTPLISWEPSQ